MAQQDLLVINKLGQTVEFLDLERRRSVASLSLPPRPHELLLSPDGRTAYVSIYGDGIYGNNIHPGHQIAAIDLVKRELTGLIELGAYRAPHGLAWDAAGLLWLTCDKSGAVLALDPQTQQIRAEVPTDTKGTHWVVATPDGGKLYASNKDTDYLSVINTKRRSLQGTIAVANGVEGITVSPDGSRVYAADHSQPGLYAIDTATDSVLQRVPLANFPPIPFAADHEMRVRVTPDGRWIVISAYQWNLVVIVEASDLSRQRIISAGQGPMGFAFPEDSRLVYVANHDGGTISVIDLEQGLILDTFSSGTTPHTGPETMEFIPPVTGSSSSHAL